MAQPQAAGSFTSTLSNGQPLPRVLPARCIVGREGIGWAVEGKGRRWWRRRMRVRWVAVAERRPGAWNGCGWGRGHGHGSALELGELWAPFQPKAFCDSIVYHYKLMELSHELHASPSIYELVLMELVLKTNWAYVGVYD